MHHRRSSSVQLLSGIWLFEAPGTAACQAFLSIINSWSLLKLMSIESVMPSNQPILYHPLLLLPSICPSIRVFSRELVLLIKWPQFWSFSFRISPSNDYSGLISFRIDCFDLLAVKGTQEPSPTPQFKSINSPALSFLYGPILIHTQLLEKPQLWLYGPLSAKECPCFLICSLPYVKWIVSGNLLYDPGSSTQCSLQWNGFLRTKDTFWLELCATLVWVTPGFTIHKDLCLYDSWL